MKTYQVSGAPVTFPAGTNLVLAEAQIAPRAHNLKIIDRKRGMVETVVEADFKVGETVGLDKIPKGMEKRLVAVAAKAA